jgi:hypothetical protein
MVHLDCKQIIPCPYGTDSRLNLFQAINCLAAIIQSLRDRSTGRAGSIVRMFTNAPGRATNSSARL